MCGLFTPLINRLTLSQVLACPGHTCENRCEGRALHWPDTQPGQALTSSAAGGSGFQSGPLAVTVAFTLKCQAPEAS